MKLFENVNGRTQGRTTDKNIAHPEHSSGELKRNTLVCVIYLHQYQTSYYGMKLSRKSRTVIQYIVLVRTKVNECIQRQGK